MSRLDLTERRAGRGAETATLLVIVNSIKVFYLHIIILNYSKLIIISYVRFDYVQKTTGGEILLRGVRLL